MKKKNGWKTTLTAGIVGGILTLGTWQMINRPNKRINELEQRIENKMDSNKIVYENYQNVMNDNLDSMQYYVENNLDSMQYYVENNLDSMKNRIDEKVDKSQNWVKKRYRIKTPLEALAKAYSSVYQIKNIAYYQSTEGADSGKVHKFGVSGSGLLLKDGYFLTARHVINVEFPESAMSIEQKNNQMKIGNENYFNSEIIFPTKKISKDYRFKKNVLTIGELNIEVEKVIVSDRYDYALLKIKGTERFRKWLNLPYWKKGFNLPKKIKPGMRSAAMGYSLGQPKTMRLGNISAIDGKMAGEEYIGIKNDVLPGDSGGPIFVIEDGEVKLVGIASWLYQMRDFVSYHPTNLGGALRADVIQKDIKEHQK